MTALTESRAEAIYGRAPVFLQNVACSYYGWKQSRVRYGREFDRRLAWLLESEHWSAADINAYQDEQLRGLIAHAYDTVPYYRETMKALKLTPRDITGREDLGKLPVLTKEDVHRNQERLVSSAAERKSLIHGHTSGTAGKSLQFYVSQSTLAFQWAVWWRHRHRFGLYRGERSANFTGKLVVPPEQRNPPYWRWNRAMNQALINMQHITDAKVEDIVSFLDRHGFAFWSGYPSIVHALVVTAQEAGARLGSPPRLVCTGAENVLEFQRRDIEAFTGATLTDQYGVSEACGNASQCPEFAYHEDFEFGILEAAEPECDAEGRTRGRILCTAFANPDFPLIRYEIGDVGLWERGDRSCPCGRESSMLVAIEGRKDDYVITPEGRRIMRFDYVFKDTVNVKEAQVVQDRPGAVTLRLVTRSGYVAADEQFVREEMRRWISPLLEVQFEYVDAIEREGRGKFKAVSSRL